MSAVSEAYRPPWRDWRACLRWDLITLTVLLLFGAVAGNVLGSKLTNLFIYAILALGLNVVVGYAGLFHLGIGAFFAIGAYITGIVTTITNPFHGSFAMSLALATIGASICGVLLCAPTLRLRGDYLALVTLGFSEVVKVVLENVDHITAGTKSLSVPPPVIFGIDMRSDYRWLYYLTLTVLALVVVLLRNLECSRLGRALVALREDELAASCMAINTARVKLSAFALSAALAGLAGCLYVTRLGTTSEPQSYGFNLSIFVLCYLILGGLGSIRGVLLGVLLLGGYEFILVPWAETLHIPFRFNDWKLMTFGLVLIVMVRFRPEGLLPSRRVQHELHSERPPGDSGHRVEKSQGRPSAPGAAETIR